jgi:hypothetical protein
MNNFLLWRIRSLKIGELYDAIDAAITRTRKKYNSCQTTRLNTNRREQSRFVNLFQEENSEIQCYDEIQDMAKEV